ncbi:sensor histidine kinase [Patescibacteria group bacterium]
MFKSARIKLTVWYLLMIMLVSGFFSMVVYRVISSEVDRLARSHKLRMERQIELDESIFLERKGRKHFMPILDPELVNETKNRLVLILLLINGGILFIAGGLGYILAGKTLNPIQEMMDDQSQFITDASHELRTPITSLKSAMEVGLRDKKFNLKDAKTLIKENIREIDNLQRLSDELLELASYRNSNGFTAYEEVSMQKVITEAVKKISPISKLKNVKIEKYISDINLEANYEGLIKLIVIILDNAIKYSSKNKKIEVKAKKEKGCAVITISDEGIGIEKKDIPHIFERFYRAERARGKYGPTGFGLGLPIAKEIVEAHSGNISVDKSSKIGSKFIVKIPVKQSVKLVKPPFFS